MADWETGIDGVGTGSATGACPTVAWSANGDSCPSSRIADSLVSSFPAVTVCMWVYAVGPTRGTPFSVDGGAKYVRAV